MTHDTPVLPLEAHPSGILTLLVTLAKGAKVLIALSVLGFVAGIVNGLTAPAIFNSTVAFMPSAAESGASGLSGLAGQFGVRLPSGSGSMALSSDAFTEVIRSKAFLEALAADTVYRGEGTRRARITIAAAIGEEAGPAALQQAKAARILRTRLLVQQDRRSDIIRVSVATRWPEVSEGILQVLLQRLDSNVKRLRASVDSSELDFAVRQSESSRRQLRSSEAELANFDDSNRGAQQSPYLRVQRERLERQVALAQDLFSSLEQTRIETSLRTLRNAQSMLVLEEPTPAAIRNARGTVGKALLGGVLGFLAGVLVLLGRGQFHRALSSGDPDAQTLVNLVRRTWPSRRA
jgi:uncharacterized protein involved in exopolysaccharide biosynthesis